MLYIYMDAKAWLVINPFIVHLWLLDHVPSSTNPSPSDLFYYYKAMKSHHPSEAGSSLISQPFSSQMYIELPAVKNTPLKVYGEKSSEY